MRSDVLKSAAAVAAVSLVGCGMLDQSEDPVDLSEEDASGEKTEEEKETGVAVLGNGKNNLETVEVEEVVGSDAGLAGPRDIEFNPEREGEAWIVNRADHSTVVVKDVGTEDQSAEKFDGRNSRHFSAKVSALAFGKPGHMATAQQENEKTQPETPEDFMGVTLWSTDLETFDAGHSGHLDMLHNSPLASGIAWEEGNSYWVFDGGNGALTRYDFKDDHGPGGTEHGDGVVRRYLDGKLEVVEGTVAHVALDRESGFLYAADTGNGRVVVLNTESGEVGDSIFPNYDGSDQKYVRGPGWEEEFVRDGAVDLERPAGLELHDGRVFVGDNATSTIHAFGLKGEHLDSLDLSERVTEGGMMGLGFDSAGQLYVVDAEAESVLRVTPASEEEGAE